MTSQVDDIPFVDVTVRSESLQDDLFKIIQARFPTVRREQVTFEECQGRLILGNFYKRSSICVIRFLPTVSQIINVVHTSNIFFL